MTLPARAAAIRGDNYHHAIGLRTLLDALDDRFAHSIRIEDPLGGAFDDVVLRRTDGQPGLYRQVKSSNYGDAVIDEKWLTTAKSKNGSSPLQAFYKTWRDLTDSGEPFDLELVTNRNYDHNTPLFDALDLKNDRLDISKLNDAANRRTDLGKMLKRLATHLSVDTGEVIRFLASVRFLNERSETELQKYLALLMRLNGFRDDNTAIDSAMRMVSDWVTDGIGEITIVDARRRLEGRDLLARNGTLVFAVHGIDRDESNVLPNVRVDYTDLYTEQDPFERRRITNPDAWNQIVLPRISDGARKLETFASRRAHVVGSMRLPTWFAVGRRLPGVRGWVLSVDQEGVEWATNQQGPAVNVTTVWDDGFSGAGTDLAVCVALRHDPTPEVRDYLSHAEIAAGKLLTLSGDGAVGPHAVTDGAWAASWTASVQDALLAAVKEIGAKRIHLFIAGPAAVALMLGHRWNVLPAVTVYEYFPSSGYEPTFNFPA